MRFANPKLQEIHDCDKPVVVVTAHRRENWGAGLLGIAEGVAGFATSHPECSSCCLCIPTRRVGEVLTSRLSGLDNVLLTQPLGYATFARLLGRSTW